MNSLFELVNVKVFDGFGDDWDNRTLECMEPTGIVGEEILKAYLEKHLPASVMGLDSRTPPKDVSKWDEHRQESSRRHVSYHKDGRFLVSYIWGEDSPLNLDEPRVSYEVVCVYEKEICGYPESIKIFSSRCRMEGCEPYRGEVKTQFESILHGLETVIFTSTSVRNG